MPGPLSNIRVLDLSRVLAGPLATQFLGDLGADVVKVERPGSGDDSRAYGPHFVDAPDGSARTSAFYLSANRNKRSITCDFSTGEGRAQILKLAERCDVFVENFTVGTLSQYGLDYEALSKINPGIIYASLTGYGQDGPYAARAGYDAVFQAQGGWMSLVGEPDGAWFKTGPSLVDVFSGQWLASGILAALYDRDARGGAGQHIDLGLLDCAVAALTHVGVNYLNSGQLPPRLGNTSNGGGPSDVFQCADGPIYISTGGQAHFLKLCQILGCTELFDDPRFATALKRFEHRHVLNELLSPFIARQRRTELARALSDEGVPAGVLNNLHELFDDAQVKARGMKVQMNHERLGEVDLIANPLRFSRTPVAYRSPPPLVGENDADLTSLWSEVEP